MPRKKRKKTPEQQAPVPNLLWGENKVPSRGPKPSLTTQQIVRAAIRIADVEGLDAISMQRLARTLDVTTMALYRYFPGKAELVDLMIDNAAPGTPPDLSAISGWRPKLEEWTRQCWSIYRRHPWIRAATARQRVLGPNELAWLDLAMGALAEAGLTGAEQHKAFLVLIRHV